MFSRYTPSRTTSSNVAAAARRTLPMLSSACSVCLTTSPAPTRSPVALDPVVEPIAPVVAHRRDDVVPAHVIAGDLEHRVSPVALQVVPDDGGQPQQRGPGMGGGQPLGPVALRERDEVRDLLPLQVNDLHQMARPGGKGRAVAAGNQYLPPREIGPRRFGR